MCTATTKTKKLIRSLVLPLEDEKANLFELREAYQEYNNKLTANSPENVADIIKAYAFEDVEHLGVLFLDSANHVIDVHEVSSGLVNQTPIHPREAFRQAVKKNAVSVIFFHNHPSGNPHESAEDIAITKVLVSAGQILQIPVLDHVVIAKGGFSSINRHRPDIFTTN